MCVGILVTLDTRRWRQAGFITSGRTLHTLFAANHIRPARSLVRLKHKYAAALAASGSSSHCRPETGVSGIVGPGPQVTRFGCWFISPVARKTGILLWKSDVFCCHLECGAGRERSCSEARCYRAGLQSRYGQQQASRLHHTAVYCGSAGRAVAGRWCGPGCWRGCCWRGSPALRSPPHSRSRNNSREKINPPDNHKKKLFLFNSYRICFSIFNCNPRWTDWRPGWRGSRRSWTRCTAGCNR